ncbi:hypothetical protein BT93_H0930 [Corymbia citriodora subsp. variegata]|uniref:Uncharacterized protein n=1 Tax=Corymbia citriodora subsp. variegata TaxID=360336 RepID=A0A8T0CG95_CORYI|nr:hypothetical protein BT93_L4067 [Corymbia citriodora subsp. variegata]KAF8015274.1 hypothetical protein BT93_H0930 [Corymbia citriodora subsp. variegata]
MAAAAATTATTASETLKMASWKKTISSPFRKARTFFIQSPSRDKKSHQEHGKRVNMMNLQGEVMACAYEDVQVMWSILDKSNAIKCD